MYKDIAFVDIPYLWDEVSADIAEEMRILEKMNMENNAELIHHAIQQGLRD